MFLELNEIAKQLDEHIEKGEKLELKKSRKQKGLDLIKAYSFDPYNPTQYTEDSGYYNPYRLVDGAYLPYPVEYWRSQGKSEDTDSYLTTQLLYDKFAPIKEAEQGFRAFKRSLDNDLFKAVAVPIGTVHTYSDGQRYVKQAEGKWVPVAANDGRTRKYLDHPNKQWSKMANDQISSHADRIGKIKGAIEKRSKEVKAEDAPKLQQALDTLKTHFSKFYEDGKIPDEVHEFFEKVSKNPDGLPAKGKPDKESNKDVEDAPRKHHIGVHFKHNGQNYTHEFKDIQASSHGDAVSKIMKIMETRLPGHQLTAIHAKSGEQKETQV